VHRLGISLRHLVFQHRLWGSGELELIPSAQLLRTIRRYFAGGEIFVWEAVIPASPKAGRRRFMILNLFQLPER